jgi:membrane protein implicated in regulation of membrane protease activity
LRKPKINGLAALIFWVAVWYLAALWVNNPLLLPTPVDVLRRLGELAITASFWQITFTSIGRILLGVVSGVALALLRPLAKKYFTPRITRTNVDALAGKTCLCVTAIDNLTGAGQVRIGDVEWTARSTTGEPIPVGEQVRIDRVEGVKVYVTPISVKV